MNMTVLIRCRVTACLLIWVTRGILGLPIRPRWAGGLDLGSDDYGESTAEDERVDWSYQALGRGVRGAARDYISEVRERAHYGLRSATVSLRPMS